VLETVSAWFQCRLGWGYQAFDARNVVILPFKTPEIGTDPHSIISIRIEPPRVLARLRLFKCLITLIPSCEKLASCATALQMVTVILCYNLRMVELLC
jgi:hypothetical protein